MVHLAAEIKEAGHPGFLGSVFGAYGVQRRGKSRRNLGESLPHGFEAHAGVGAVEPVIGSLGRLDGQGEMLMLAQPARQGN